MGLRFEYCAVTRFQIRASHIKQADKYIMKAACDWVIVWNRENPEPQVICAETQESPSSLYYIHKVTSQPLPSLDIISLLKFRY